MSASVAIPVGSMYLCVTMIQPGAATKVMWLIGAIVWYLTALVS